MFKPIKTNDYRWYLEGQDTEWFIHLEVYNWNKTVLLELREELDKLLLRLNERGIPSLFFYLTKDKPIKFHKLIKPLDYEVFFGPKDEYFMGGWSTGE